MLTFYVKDTYLEDLDVDGDNFKTMPCQDEERIHLVQDTDKSRVTVSTVMNIWVRKGA